MSFSYINQNMYNTGFTTPVLSPMLPVSPVPPVPAVPTGPVRAYTPAFANPPFKMDFFSPSTVGQISTPRHRGNFPYGFNGQINFYDPLTGRAGPSVSTLPQVQTMINKPNGLNVNIVGNSSDVSKVRQLLDESNNDDDCESDGENEYLELTDANLKKLQDEIKKPKKKLNLQKKIKKEENCDGEFYELTDANLKKLSAEIQESKRKQTGGHLIFQNTIPNSQWKLMGDLLVHSSLATTYSGSGVLLFDKFIQNNTELLTVIMGQEENGEFGDFGGMISTFQPNSIENSLAENAKNKIYEESCSSIFLQSNIYNFYKADVNYDVNNSLYRCFLIGVSGDITECTNDDLTNILRSNRNLNKKYYGLTPNMQKIKSISRFDLRVLLRIVKNEIEIDNEDRNKDDKVIAVDIDGKSCVLSNRVVKVLQHLINNMKAYTSIYTDMLQSKLTSNNKIKTLIIN
jgi:hypothetical protein